MRKLTINNKLTLILGFVSTLVVILTFIIIGQLLFYSTERQIQNDLSNHHADIIPLANPEKSTDLANYLRSNDLSLYIYNDNKEIIARYGIYRNIDEKTLKSLINLPRYSDKNLLDYGEFDIYNKDNIQIATKNTVLYILRKSFYICLAILLPIVWMLSAIASIFATNIVLSPLLKAKNISHELKTPLARVASTLQVVLDSAPDNIKKKIKYSVTELIDLGNNVDSILSLSLLKKDDKNEQRYSNLKREINRVISTIEKSKIKISIPRNMIIPVPTNEMNIILRNLISNAVKYNKDEKAILIKANSNGRNWELAISNHIDDSNKKKESYGLGITIVKDICHNENIEFKIQIINNQFIAKLSNYEK